MWHTYMTCQMSDSKKWITVEIKMGKTQSDMQIYARTHVVKKLLTLIIFKRYQYSPRGGCTQISKKIHISTFCQRHCHCFSHSANNFMATRGGKRFPLRASQYFHP